MAAEGDLVNLRGDLLAQISRFDEDSFVALGNRGLLRRAQKDLELQCDVRMDVTDDVLTVHVSQQQVRFDRRGPAHAKCPCPSSGVCQHILAASLWLQRQLQSEGLEKTAIAGDEATETGTEALMHELLTIDESLLRKHAGKSGYRWAWQFVHDLDFERDMRLGGDRHLTLAFERLRLTFRFMGGGLDQMIADTQTSHIEKYRVAAVLALRRSQGLVVPPPEPLGKAKTRALDLGKDHSLPDTRRDARVQSRIRLRRSAEQLIEECIELGLSHLSSAIQERFSALATWAQGCEYHRLALGLRRVADHIELLLERSGGADEHRLFDELTIAYGLILALHAAEQRGLDPGHLVGRARHRYDESATLELVGLGALPWRSASGYVGLTMLFWSTEDRSFLSCTDARPELQRGFSPIQRYRSIGPWSLSAPAEATGRRIFLSKPQISAAGRISGSERTHATLLPVVDHEALLGSLAPAKNWKALAQSRAESHRSVLAQHEPMKDWVALLPAQFECPVFDAARQTLVVPLLDDTSAVLVAEIPYSELNAHAINRMERWRTSPPQRGTVLIARLHETSDGLTAEPLSLLAAIGSADAPPVDALHFDPDPVLGFVDKEDGKSDRTERPADSVSEVTRSAMLPTLLSDLLDWLRRHAERGAPKSSQAALQAEWSSRFEALRMIGLTAFGDEPSVDFHTPSRILKTNYLAIQYGLLLGSRLEPHV